MESVILGCSLSIGRLVCGPGFEAAHVFPQSQWLAFPLRDDPPPGVGPSNMLAIRSSGPPQLPLDGLRLPPPSSPGTPATGSLGSDIDIARAKETLLKRYSQTWSPRSGITLRADIHSLFDSRLITIHPSTLKTRLFADIPWLLKYHGQQAQLLKSEPIPSYALEWHYNQCVIENICCRQFDERGPGENSVYNLSFMKQLKQLGIKLKAAAGPRDLARDLVDDGDDEHSAGVSSGNTAQHPPTHHQGILHRHQQLACFGIAKLTDNGHSAFR